MSYFYDLLKQISPSGAPASPLGAKPVEMEARINECRRLTELLEQHSTFSMVRLGDMDLGMLLAQQDGVDDPFGLKQANIINGTMPFGHPGIGMRYANRMKDAFQNADYVDFHQRLWPIGPLLPQLNLPRDKSRLSNPDAETSYILLTWVEKEFFSYCCEHRVGFAGAEARLLEHLLQDLRFRETAKDYFDENQQHYFHQIRNDGRTIDDDLDLIKEDLRQFIQNTGIDTLFLSLGGAAKILCYELAKECNIRAIDFGAMMRGLTFSGSDGQSATRATHSPFYFRVPFLVYMQALEKAFSSMPPEVKLAKAHAQLLRELQPCVIGWTSAGTETPQVKENYKYFRESYDIYREEYRYLFNTNKKCQQERAGFLHYCGKWRLTNEGIAFSFPILLKHTTTKKIKCIVRQTPILGNITKQIYVYLFQKK